MLHSAFHSAILAESLQLGLNKMEKDEKKNVPPYVSYASFKSFIKGLGETIVPDRIDKSVMKNYSGSIVYALIPTLVWLGLIDSKGIPQKSLRSLAEASKDDDLYKNAIGELLEARYTFLADAGVNLKTAAGGQVEEAFKSQGISGATVSKAMTFFINMAKHGGITLSNHIKAPSVPRKQSAKKNKGGSTNGGASESEGAVKPTKPGYESFEIPIPGTGAVKVSFPENMTESQWNMFSAVLKAYTDEALKVKAANAAMPSETAEEVEGTDD